MPWPDIFFKARKLPPEPVSPASPKAEPEAPKNPATEVKPMEATAIEAKPARVLEPPISPPALTPAPATTAPIEGGTRTIPVVHGVVLRPSARVVLGPPAQPVTPMKNIEQLMTEADPVKTLRQTGSIHLLKRLAPDPSAPPVIQKPPGSVPANTPASLSAPVLPAAGSPWPQFSAKTPAPVPLEVQKPEPVLATTPAPVPILTEVKKPDAAETPFILKPAGSSEKLPSEPGGELPDVEKPPAETLPVEMPVVPPSAAEPSPVKNPVPEPPPPPIGSIFRRKAKLADVARIVLPPKRDESTRLPFPPHPETAPTVVPPAFPVSTMTQRPIKPIPEQPEPVKVTPDAVTESPFLERNEAKKETPKPVEAEAPPAAPVAEQKPLEPMPLFPDPPKVDPEAHKPEKIDASVPKVDPEAHRPPPSPAPLETSKTLSVAPEKREFHLTNGEHVAGVVLSETPEAFYVEHATLGVITVPRKEIAKRLVEIILTNGDRIVGDIMAETADTLYVRHASLGMLTVPRSHRSQRVVEAILKDGDRILGEVLTETDTFTVIRSATLGTITVPHTKLAMLNRKVEQIEMKTLPPPVAELKDKA